MNAKYVFALILVLQVSMSLCALPEPSPEMVELYNTHKATFMKRLMNFYNKVHAAATPVVEGIRDNERSQDAREFAENLQSKPEYQAFVKVATAIGQEAIPLVDKARTAALGVYEYYLRPHIGITLGRGIDHAKSVLDEVLPAE
ncbi:apolipoprotein A-II [Neolamprologus brichardi]|uniref:Apolipoprotein A-II n=1 Tax=Neolamprologus brichardi TaxID=32507 RepID=A0A3Q4HG27_NEOBR|nr:apolipoprotein A-II [Neolamprologus brichardi]